MGTGMVDREDDEESVISAYHEAGHAVVAHLAGATVRQISMETSFQDGPSRHGQVEIGWPEDPRRSRGLCMQAIHVALAGPVAEMIYRGDALHPGFVPEWREDWQQAWGLAESIWKDERSRLQQLEQLTTLLHQRLSHDRLWNAIAALADEIQAHEILDEEEVVAILDDWI